MMYKLKTFIVEDIRTGRIYTEVARSRRTLDKRLGDKRVSEVLIREAKVRG